jgi:hypothetical protein
MHGNSTDPSQSYGTSSLSPLDGVSIINLIISDSENAAARLEQVLEISDVAF